jgi:hypothetical protein
MVSRSIETAQRKVEGRNFDVRKQLLEYDDVANDQRKVLYAQRNEVLEAQSISETIDNLRNGTFTDLVASHVPEGSVEEQWDIDALQMALEADWHINLPLTDFIRESKTISEEDILEKVLEAAQASYQLKATTVGAESWAGFERSIMLQVIDTQWREHLSALDHLRQGIHLRGYAQKNPKQEYKREAFELFSSMLDRVRDDVVRVLMTVRIHTQEVIEQAELEAALLAGHVVPDLQRLAEVGGRKVAQHGSADVKLLVLEAAGQLLCSKHTVREVLSSYVVLTAQHTQIHSVRVIPCPFTGIHAGNTSYRAQHASINTPTAERGVLLRRRVHGQQAEGLLPAAQVRHVNQLLVVAGQQAANHLMGKHSKVMMQ